MKARLAAVSLAALAWSQAAAAQPTVSIAPGADAPGAMLPVDAPAFGPAVAPLAAPTVPDPASVETRINPDTGNLSLGTTVTRNGSVHTIDGGTRAGANLFHSFSRFDLGQGDFARWVHSAGDPAAIRNVVSRVTGGDPSHIFGTLDSTAIPNADFFFINPAGIVFGDGARVNVPAAAHFSTAHELRFADGPAFTVATPNGSTFSVANPAAFGFVGAQGDIAMHGAGDLVARGTSLSLSAANISIRRSSVEAGSLAFSAVGDAAAAIGLDGTTPAPLGGTIAVVGTILRPADAPQDDGGFTGGGGDLEQPAAEAFQPDTRLTATGPGGVRLTAGSIAVSRADVSADGGTAAAGGALALTARDSLSLTEAARLSTSTAGGQAGAIDIAAGTLEVRSGASIRSEALAACADCVPTGRTGDIRVTADRIEIVGDNSSDGATTIRTDAAGEASGGNITLAARDILIATGGNVSASTSGAGDAGSIDVRASSRLVMVDEGLIGSVAAFGSTGGNAGDIQVRAPLVELRDSSISSTTFAAGAAGDLAVHGDEILLDGFSASLDSSSGLFATGAAGSLTVEATQRILLSNEASFNAFSSGPADGGLVLVRAPDVTLTGGATINTFSFCIFDACGRGGTIAIFADRLALLSDAMLSAGTAGAGGAGDIHIRAGDLVMERAGISSETVPGLGPQSGPAGSVEIDVDRLTMRDGSVITSRTTGSGDAGSVLIRAGEAELRGSSITSTSAPCFDDGCGGPLGAAGNVVIVGERLTLAAGADASSSLISTSTAGDEDAGSVRIAVDSVTVSGDSRISSSTSGAGNAGAVSLVGRQLLLQNGRIETVTQGSGDAGKIEIEMVDVALLEASRITSDAGEGCTDTCDASGDAGSIAIAAADLALVDSSTISSSTEGAGNAGAVGIALTGNLLLDFQSKIQTNTSASSSGAAGEVTVIAGGDILLDNGSNIGSTVEGSGDGGVVTIVADELLMDRGATITTDTFANCDTCAGKFGGNIGIAARVVTLMQSDPLSTLTFIASDTFGTAGAGSVTVATTESLTVKDRAFIASDTYAAGEAGVVVVGTPRLVIDSGQIRSAAQSGSTGAAGVVTIDAGNLLIRNDGAISTSSADFTSGDAGNILVSSDVIRMERGAIRSTTGIGTTGDAGAVFIRTGQLDLLDTSLIGSDTSGTGDAGLVVINAASIALADSSISSRALCLDDACAGLGEAGDVLITATDALTVRTTSPRGTAAVSTNTDGNKDAGNVFINAGRIEVDGAGALIQSATAGGGDAGRIVLRGAGDLSVTNGGAVGTRAQRGSTGDAGEVEIDMAGQILVESGFITSSSLGTGAAGTVDLSAARLVVDLGGSVTSSAGPEAGPAGTVTIAARDVLVDRAGTISTGTEGAGEAGLVSIDAPGSLRVLNRGVISSNTSGAGRAGGVQISAGAVELAGDSQIASRTERGEGSTGDAGLVGITARSLLVRDGASITSSTVTSGDAGRVRVTVGDVVVTERGTITSTTTGAGDAGTVEIRDAGSLRVDQSGRISSTSLGTGAAGDVSIGASRITLATGGTIESNAGPAAARAGTIGIRTDTLTMADASAISTSTIGQGPAGQIEIRAGDISLDTNARIASNTGGRCEAACVQTGDAGEIDIVATGTISVLGGAQISSNGNTGSGDAGLVGVTADRLLLSGGRISTSTAAESSGESGIVAVTARDLLIDQVGSIETISRNDKPAGLIAIEAASLVLRGVSARITSSNEGQTGGAAGGILITSGDLRLIDGAQINTTSRSGAAGDIAIAMPNDAFLRLESIGIPSKIDTSSGPGTGGRIVITNPFAIISNGGSILALGQSGGANVEIVTNYFIRSSDRTNLVAVNGDFLLEAVAYDVSAGTVNRDLSVIDASGVLRGQCAAVRQTGQVSQLVVRPIGPYGTRPAGAAPADRTRLLTAAELGTLCS